jgi:hypothetical protein
MSFTIRTCNHIIKKNLGKSMIYYNTPVEKLGVDVEKAFN